MVEVSVNIDSCTVCPYEGVDDKHDGMVCTLEEPAKEIIQPRVDIPLWCPLRTVKVHLSTMVKIDSLLSCLKHRHANIMEKIGEYQEIIDILNEVQKYTR